MPRCRDGRLSFKPIDRAKLDASWAPLPSSLAMLPTRDARPGCPARRRRVAPSVAQPVDWRCSVVDDQNFATWLTPSSARAIAAPRSRRLNANVPQRCAYPLTRSKARRRKLTRLRGECGGSGAGIRGRLRNERADSCTPGKSRGGSPAGCCISNPGQANVRNHRQQCGPSWTCMSRALGLSRYTILIIVLAAPRVGGPAARPLESAPCCVHQAVS